MSAVTQVRVLIAVGNRLLGRDEVPWSPSKRCVSFHVSSQPTLSYGLSQIQAGHPSCRGNPGRGSGLVVWHFPVLTRLSGQSESPVTSQSPPWLECQVIRPPDARYNDFSNSMFQRAAEAVYLCFCDTSMCRSAMRQ